MGGNFNVLEGNSGELARSGEETAESNLLLAGSSSEGIERLSLLTISQDRPGNETVGNKLVRQASVLGGGITDAFIDVAKEPGEKLPEVALAAGAGVGLSKLSQAGAKGRMVTLAGGLLMQGKVLFDEISGDRFSKFGEAMSLSWDSEANYELARDATRNSIGSLTVDTAVGFGGFKAGQRVFKKAPIETPKDPLDGFEPVYSSRHMFAIGPGEKFQDVLVGYRRVNAAAPEISVQMPKKGLPADYNEMNRRSWSPNPDVWPTTAKRH